MIKPQNPKNFDIEKEKAKFNNSLEKNNNLKINPQNLKTVDTNIENEKLLNKSPRMLAIYNMVKNNNIHGHLIDIGCDHAKISCCLIKNNIVSFITLVDKSQKSLNKGIKTFENNKIDKDKYNYFVSDGFTNVGINNKIDFALITGLGGEEIIKIINTDTFNVKNYIISPQHDELNVKKYLVKNKYSITLDEIYYDNGKYYNIINAVKQNLTSKYSRMELQCGKNNIKNFPLDFVNYFNYKIEILNKIIENIKISQSNCPKLKQLEIELTNFIKVQNLYEKYKKGNENE